jgi:hypothetical protein
MISAETTGMVRRTLVESFSTLSLVAMNPCLIEEVLEMISMPVSRLCYSARAITSSRDPLNPLPLSKRAAVVHRKDHSIVAVGLLM